MPTKNSIKVGVIDFFAGCGGASYGFTRARVPGVEVEIVAGIDIDVHACATYNRMLRAPVYPLDIANLVNRRALELKSLIREWSLSRYDKIVLIGCAPCQGFAAHRKSIKGSDARRSLFARFADIARIIQPDAIFMENVPDMFSKPHWPHYSHAKSKLEKAGYMVRSRIYNFAGFGLPQERFRAVMLALRKPFNMPEPPFGHERYVTVRDAIGHLRPLKAGEVDSKDVMHIVSKHRPETVDILRKVPKDGGNRPVGVGPACLDRARASHGGYTDVYGRLAWDKPALTITARCRTPSCGRFAHPEQNRGLSVREAALLQGFPPNYQFEGPFDDKYKQIGNAVPPVVAMHFAEHILMRLKTGRVSELVNGYEHDVALAVGPGFAITINGIKRKRDTAEIRHGRRDGAAKGN
jgi:DNA (cytosine-5)-methyltransferase 1